jgi:hypothetical protein
MTKVIRIIHEHSWSQELLSYGQAILRCTQCGLWVYDKREEPMRVNKLEEAPTNE